MEEASTTLLPPPGITELACEFTLTMGTSDAQLPPSDPHCNHTLP